MRFMMRVKATADPEAGKIPSEKLIAAMADCHEELVRGGMLLDTSGLQASSKAWRISTRARSVASATAPSRRPRN